MRPTTDSGSVSPLRATEMSPVVAVERHRELARVLGVELLAQPGGDRLLDVGVDLLALDVLVAGDAVDDADQFWIHASIPHAIQLCAIQLCSYSVVRTHTVTNSCTKQKRPPIAGGPRSRSEPVSETTQPLIRKPSGWASLPRREIGPCCCVMQVHGRARWLVLLLRFIPVSPGSKKWTFRRSTYTVACVSHLQARLGLDTSDDVIVQGRAHVNVHVAAQRLDHVQLHAQRANSPLASPPSAFAGSD